MEMEVIHRLASVWARVSDNSVALIEALFSGNLSREREKVAKHFLVARFG
jgi:hypothetical protein